jgi:hypothetical protein
MINASKTIFFSLLFFLFFYLSNSLILSDLTDSTKPLSFLYIHYWFHEQFLINYRELGFVKRGLVGTIMNTNFENYVLLSKIYSLTIISLITVLFSLIIVRSKFSKNHFNYIILFSVSPFFFQNLGFEFGRLDQISILFSIIIAYLVISKKKIYVVEIIAPFLILIHELIFFTFVNFLIYIQFSIKRPNINKYYVIIMSAIILIFLFLFGGIENDIYLQTKDKYKFIEIYFNKGHIESAMFFWKEILIFENYLNILRHLFSILLYLFAAIYFLKLFKINYHSLIYIGLFTILFVIPVDHSRALSFFLINIVLLIIIKIKLDHLLINLPDFKYRYFLILLLGPIGTSTAFPILGVLKRIFI